MHELILTEENFAQEVLQSELPVLVDFWAPWCAPCRMLAPVIEEIAAEHAATLKVGKVNVDEQGGLAARFGVSSIPTVLVFERGALKASSIGYRPKQELLALL